MGQSPRRPATLGVLADPYVRADDVRTLERAIDETGVSVPLVVVNAHPNPAIDPITEAKAVNDPIGIDTVRALFEILDEHRAWTLVFAEKKLSEELGLKAATTNRIHVSDVPGLSNSDILYVTPRSDGNWLELPSDAVEQLRDRCDVAVRFGFGLLGGDALSAPEHGVLSFHLADIRAYRGLGVSQAWLDGCDTMGVTLQRLSEHIDGGEIIAYAETDVSECATLWEAHDVLYELKETLLAGGIENLRDPSFEPTVPDSLGPYYSVDRHRKLSFAGRTLLKDMAGQLGRLTGVH